MALVVERRRGVFDGEWIIVNFIALLSELDWIKLIFFSCDYWLNKIAELCRRRDS